MAAKQLIKFEAAWCGPCRMWEPIVKKLADMYGLELVHVDVDEQPDVAEKADVRGLPTLVLMDEDGTETARTTGARIFAAAERDLGLKPLDRVHPAPQ